MKAKVGVNLSGKIKLTLTDIRDGSKQVIEKNNMLLNHFWDQWFTSSVTFGHSNSMNTCFLGTGDIPPQPTDTGLSGTTLASNSSPGELVVEGVSASRIPVSFVNAPNITAPTVGRGYFTIEGNYMAFPDNSTSTLYLCKQTPSLDFEVTDTILTDVGTVTNVVISRDLSKVLVCGNSPPYVELYSITTSDTLDKISIPTLPEQSYGGAFSLNSNLIYLGAREGSELLALTVGAEGYTVEGIEAGIGGSIQFIDISLDGNFLAVAYDSTIKVYKIEEQDLVLHGELTTKYSMIPRAVDDHSTFAFLEGNYLSWVVAGRVDSSTRSTGLIKVDESGITVVRNEGDYYYRQNIKTKNYYPRSTSFWAVRSNRSVFGVPYSRGSSYSSQYISAVQEDGLGNLYSYNVDDSFQRIPSQDFSKPLNLLFSRSWSFPAGVGTGLVKEVGLRTATTSPYSSRWLARQVLDHPIEKTEFQQLDVEWEISVVGVSTIIADGTITQGQIDGSGDIYWRCEISPGNWLNIMSGDSKNTLFKISGTPTVYANEAITSFGEVEGHVHSNLVLTDLGDGEISSVTGSSVIEALPYTTGSFTRGIRVFLDTNALNQGIGSLSILSGTVGILSLTFDPPLQKADTHRLYIDIEFSLNLNQGGE